MRPSRGTGGNIAAGSASLPGTLPGRLIIDSPQALGATLTGEQVARWLI
jgi:hypothetical protein